MSKYLVGTRPSGKLHIGHYFSVIQPAKKYGADVLIANYHAPSEDYNKFYDHLSYYVDERQFRFQKQEFNPELYFKLLELTPSGLLNHMPQYKAKEKTAHMFTYPVLMAHDVAGYDYVIVGEDQRPHLEFAADILPKLSIQPPQGIYEGGKIMDLRHPENKMSKSEPSSCLFMDDSDYKKKIMKAVTTPEGRKNLENICKLLGEEPPVSNQELKELLITLYDKHLRHMDKINSGEYSV